MRSWSLKTKLLGTVIAFGTVLSIGITFVFGSLMKTYDHEKLKTFEGTAQTLSDAVAAQFFERYGDIQAFAINPDVRAKDRETVVAALNNYVALYGIYDLIMVVSKDGKLVAVNNKNPAGETIKSDTLYQDTYSEEPWFQAALKGEFSVDKENNLNGTLVENVHLDKFSAKVYGGKPYGNSFTTQVKDQNGNLIGVMTNRAGARWYEVALKELKSFTELKGLKSGNIFMTSNSGRILAQVSEEKDVEKLEADGNELGLQPVQLLRDKDRGSVIYSYRNNEVVAGYSKINGGKMVRSLGWNAIVQAPVNEAYSEINKAKIGLISVVSALIFLLIGSAYLASLNLSKSLAGIAHKLSDEARTLAGYAVDISENSVKLSHAVNEQAAAIQETAASADEVSATAQKCSDNAKESLNYSNKSRNAAEAGKDAVGDMVTAINDINESTNTVLKQVEHGNEQINEIVKVISEIGNKTKVINDIVFQTKLLSFNASVEAARAGEHGKGFAVVAEEVGNLAQMSGNAAKEISTMLDGSVARVNEIVDSTKSRVEILMKESRSKTDQSKVVAEKCSESLENILGTVQEVDAMVGEISSASSEQAVGVTEINKAMSSLNQTTQTNAVISQETAKQSEKIKHQADSLSRIVENFVSMIHGEGSRPTVPTQDQGPSTKGGGSVQSSPNIVSIQRAKIEKAKKTATLAQAQTHSSNEDIAYKQAGGAEGLPDVNDPRFEEA